MMRSGGCNSFFFFTRRGKKTHDPVLFPPDFSNDSKRPIADDVERFVEIQEGRCARHGWSFEEGGFETLESYKSYKGCAN